VTTRNATVEYGIATLAFLVVLFVGLGTQERIHVNAGRGYDGSIYHEVASQLASGASPTATSRFATRVGTPWLAVRASRGDLISGFQLVNLGAAFVSTLLFLTWLRQHLGMPWLRLALVVIYVSHWLQLVRFTVFYPVLVDAWAQAWCFAGLICVSGYARAASSLKLGAIAGIGAVGVVFREIVLLVPIAFLFVGNPRLHWRPRLRLVNAPALREWIPLVLAIAMLVAVRQGIVARDAEFSASNHLLEGTLSRSALSYALGWLVAFGPAIALCVFDPRPALTFFRQHTWAFVYFAGVAAAAWSGSHESERHALNWGAPVGYLLIALTVQHHVRQLHGVLLVLLLASQALINRVFWTIPQPADGYLGVDPAMVLTPLGSGVSYHHLFPDYLPPEQAWRQLWQHAAVMIGIVGIMWWRSLEPGPGLSRSRAAMVAARQLPVDAVTASMEFLRRVGMRTAIGLLVASSLVAAGTGAAVVAMCRRQPVRINVRWKEHVRDAERRAFEQQLQLANGAMGEGATWVYLLPNASPEKIRTVVQHAAVEDTAHVDRETFRAEDAPEKERRARLLGLFVGFVFACAAGSATGKVRGPR
jgi:hypothetical protein